MTPVSTNAKGKILEAARELFARDGYEITSLRTITARANVNLASVNYHFKSKDNLITEVLSQSFRSITDVSRGRLAQVIAAAYPQNPALEVVLDAFIRPCLEICTDPTKEMSMKLFGRAMAEEKEALLKVMEHDTQPTLIEFSEAFAKALPDVPREEILYRLHFTVGAIIHTACHRRDLFRLPGMTDKLDMELTLQRLITYTSAGFRAGIKKTE